MEYLELQCEISPFKEQWCDIVSAALCDIGFESFIETENGVNAYIPTKDFNYETVKSLDINLNKHFTIRYKNIIIPDQNWNEVWEKNYFQPITIGNKCLIKSPFHKIEKEAEYTIIIEPKMSFGTGHHSTTTLMLEAILKLDLKNKQVLDMGCGTCVLGILASKCGAESVLAIDIDEWAYKNSIENNEKNNITNIKVVMGDVSVLPETVFDTIFANINRNILLEDIRHYVKRMQKGSKLLLSGFYKEDIPKIREEAEKQQLTYLGFQELKNWVRVDFQL